MRSFMAHPAMAAAAMLVVVIGFATMITTRKGDQFAESTAPAVSNETSRLAAPQGTDRPEATAELENNKDLQTTPQSGEGAAGSGSAAGREAGSDSFRVDLDDSTTTHGGTTTGKDDEARNRQQADMKAELTRRDVAADKLAATDEGVRKAKGKQTETKKTITTKPPSGGYMELRTKEPGVKELDGAPAANRGAYDYESDLAKQPSNANAITPGPRGAPGAGAATAPRPEPRPAQTSRTNTVAPEAAPSRKVAPAGATATPPPPPPAPPPKVGTATGNAPSAQRPRSAAPADDRAANNRAANDRAANDPQLAWAREQHTAILAQVRAGNCKGAANIAVNLANRDRAYYEQNVATDRSVKECLAYIDNAREKDAEQRAERSRASQKRASEPAKRAVDQPAKATSIDAAH